MVKRSRSIDQLHSIDGDEFVPDDTHPEMAQQQPSVHRDVSVELIDQARPQFQACSSSRESNSESKKFKSNETQQTQVIASPVVSVLFIVAAVEASVIQRVEPELITINVQTLSGMLPPISMSAQATVRDLKLRLQTLNAEYDVDRQKLSIAASNDTDTCIVLQNHRTLQFYHIMGNANVVLVVSPSLEVAVHITDRDLNNAHHFKALLENQNLHHASVGVYRIDSHQSQLIQLFEENRSVRSVEISGTWTEEHLSFCQALLTLRPDIDIRFVVSQDTNLTMMLRVVNFCQLNKCLSINLSTHNIDAQGCTALASSLQALSSLQELGLSKIDASGCVAFARALKSMSSLQELSLTYSKIGAPGYRALQSMSSLQKLDLSFNKISAPGCRALGTAMQSMTSLTSLNLSYTCCGFMGCVEFAPALQSMPFMRSLDLRYIQIDDAGCRTLVPALQSMSSLQSLDLSSNRIDVAGFRALAPALQSMSSLTSLDLSCNLIKDEGYRILAPVLQSMASLKTLSLRFNQIGADGCRALAPALLSMSSLQSLNLSNSRIGDEGCIALTPALRSMSMLHCLDLSSNHINAKGCVALVPALLSMSWLQKLDMRCNRIGVTGSAQLKTLSLQSLILSTNGT